MIRLIPSSTSTATLFPYTTRFRSREPAPAAMAVSSAEQIEQAADEVENRNKADDRHMEAPRFASATPPPTSRGTEALERLSNLEARVEKQERSEEHTSELQSLMRISYAVLCLKKKKKKTHR